MIRLCPLSSHETRWEQGVEWCQCGWQDVIEYLTNDGWQKLELGEA